MRLTALSDIVDANEDDIGYTTGTSFRARRPW
jgi:hypothetical protein